MERSVGLVVLTEIPERGLVAVLRERGSFSFERMKPALWPGACQVTAHGKLEEGEDFLTALYREIEEELGGGFALRFLSAVARDSSMLVEAFRLKKPDKEVVTFAAKIESSFLKEIRLGPETGGIRFLAHEEVSSIVEVTSFDKATGVPDRKTIAMFSDEREAVARAFLNFTIRIGPPSL